MILKLWLEHHSLTRLTWPQFKDVCAFWKSSSPYCLRRPVLIKALWKSLVFPGEQQLRMTSYRHPASEKEQRFVISFGNQRTFWDVVSDHVVVDTSWQPKFRSIVFGYIKVKLMHKQSYYKTYIINLIIKRLDAIGGATLSEQSFICSSLHEGQKWSGRESHVGTDFSLSSRLYVFHQKKKQLQMNAACTEFQSGIDLRLGSLTSMEYF